VVTRTNQGTASWATVLPVSEMQSATYSAYRGRRVTPGHARSGGDPVGQGAGSLPFSAGRSQPARQLAGTDADDRLMHAG
jgi:hypothetical protein